MQGPESPIIPLPGEEFTEQQWAAFKMHAAELAPILNEIGEFAPFMKDLKDIGNNVTKEGENNE